jgi:hypothetical protein
LCGGIPKLTRGPPLFKPKTVLRQLPESPKNTKNRCRSEKMRPKGAKPEQNALIVAAKAPSPSLTSAYTKD